MCPKKSQENRNTYSHISRAFQLFRKGSRAWAIIRAFSDEMGCRLGCFVPLSLPVYVCQQAQLCLNSLLEPGSQQIKVCSLQMQHWGVCLLNVLWERLVWG